MSDVIVVGGGVIGLSSALELAKVGLRVTVLDQAQPAQEASWAGAGMIPPGDYLHTSTHLLALLSSALWPQLSSQLLSETGIDNGYRHCGGLLIGSETDLNRQLELWTNCGVLADRLDHKDLRDLEPQLNSEFAAAISLPMQAQVRNPRHLQALTAACLQQGVSILDQTPVVGWDVADGRILAAQTPDGPVHADEFVIAAGAWSSDIVKSLNLKLEVRPIRGQIVLFKSDRRLFSRTIEMGKRYLVPRDDGYILVGATEEDVGFEKLTSALCVDELREFATSVIPAMQQVAIEKTWSGLRPYSERKRPWIGRPEEWENLVLATGHYRAGLSNSPGTALLVRQLILDQQPEIDLTGFMN